MRIREDDGADEPGMNLTPMIDVVFLLLIFFMVATTFLEPEKEIEIDLPEAESAVEEEHQPDEIVINVFRDGRVSVNGSETSDDVLLNQLRQAAQRNPSTSVTIRGDRLSHHEAIVKVMDACGVAGLVNLAVGTLPSGG